MLTAGRKRAGAKACHLDIQCLSQRHLYEKDFAIAEPLFSVDQPSIPVLAYLIVSLDHFLWHFDILET